MCRHVVIFAIVLVLYNKVNPCPSQSFTGLLTNDVIRKMILVLRALTNVPIILSYIEYPFRSE